MANLDLPFGIDHANKERPSLTVLFCWVSFAISILSIIALHFTTKFIDATFAAISLHVVSMVFYRMRHLDKVKISKDSLELEDDEKPSV